MEEFYSYIEKALEKQAGENLQQQQLTIRRTMHNFYELLGMAYIYWNIFRTQNSECLFGYNCKAIIIFGTNKWYNNS